MKKLTPVLVLVSALAGMAFWSVIAQEKPPSPPPFHTRGALFQEPAAAPAPGEPFLADNPMALLSRPKNFSAARVSSYDRKGYNIDMIYLPPNGEEVVLADVKGPGAITHIWTTFRGSGRELIIRAYWDGSPTPSVEAPIGDFFGVAMGVNASISSYPIQNSSDGQSRNCWWYMPYNTSAKITIANLRSPDFFKDSNVALRHQNTLYYYIDYQTYARPQKDPTYFHTRFRETDPSERGKPVTLASAEGRGHFVGVVMGHRARTPGWFGEGDDIITVDGQVAFIGTGTEDYFCDAWGFRQFSNLYSGVSLFEGREAGHRLSAYRFHIIDPIPFRKSFTFEIEHWPWVSVWPNTGREYYSSTSFWYQSEIHKPWPRLTHLLSQEPWDPAKGRWFIPNAVEAEDLTILDYRSVLGASVRPAREYLMPNLSGDHYLAFDPGPGGTVSVALPVQETGTYTLRIYYLRGEDFGIAALAVNGRPAGEPVDTYLATEGGQPRAIWPPKEYVFAGVPLTAGMNVLQFRVDSKNDASKGYKIGIDCLVLEKSLP